tara:strand:+ start:477 stop:1649 length:1173 start_codon:yes stop_codon:yes gene_type:complete
VQRISANLGCTKDPKPPANQVNLYNYTRAIINDLLEHTPNLEGPLRDVDNYCLLFKTSEIPNASANHRGLIHINLGLFSIVDNDAAFAGLIAHELGHVFNSHTLPIIKFPEADAKAGKYKEEYDDLIANNIILLQNLDKADEKLRKARQLFGDVLDQASVASNITIETYNYIQENYISFLEDSLISGLTFTKIEDGADLHAKVLQPDGVDDNLVDAIISVRYNFVHSITPKSWQDYEAAEKLYYINKFSHAKLWLAFEQAVRNKQDLEEKILGPDIAANWKEQEADELSYEIYLRAGYEPSEMSKIFERYSPIRKSNNPDDCERGRKRHPNFCWRIMNFKREYEKHKEAYDRIVSKGKSVLFKFDDKPFNLTQVKADSIEILNGTEKFRR